jgi:hypothetical protein
VLERDNGGLLALQYARLRHQQLASHSLAGTRLPELPQQPSLAVHHSNFQLMWQVSDIRKHLSSMLVLQLLRSFVQRKDLLP